MDFFNFESYSPAVTGLPAPVSLTMAKDSQRALAPTGAEGVAYFMFRTVGAFNLVTYRRPLVAPSVP